MSTGLQSIVDAGTKLWLDSVDPDEIVRNKQRGATGATSNPIIISDLVESGRFDDQFSRLIEQGHDDEAIAWAMTDHLVKNAQNQFHDTWDRTAGNNGYVSFELDPLLEDPVNAMSHKDKVARYIELGRKWAKGHDNRMIKVPATPAGLDALEELAASNVTINVTLVFTERQYEIARDNVWKGAQRRTEPLSKFKSVYSIFISRVDVYTEKHVPELSDDAQGMVGIVNAKRMWKNNQDFWADKGLNLDQEIIFASTGKKLDWQDEDYYVKHMVGSDIQTNPPQTNAAIQKMGKTYARTIGDFPDQKVLDEIDQKVDVQKMEDTLMSEGTKKFADPHKKLLKKISEKRKSLAAT